MVTSISDRLIEMGRRVFDEPRAIYPFTREIPANELLNDIEHYPHAFVIACIADRQDRTERPWLMPYRIAEKLGTFEFSRLRALSVERLVNLVSEPKALCRYPVEMGAAVYKSLNIIERTYSGNAGAIWAGNPSSADVVYRFLELPGVGVKIATMATNILARTFKIPFSDYYSIDISPDRHVRRVFARLGLTREKAPDGELIYRARSLSPEFPGLLDSPVWEIGRKWCRPHEPICTKCAMRDVCPNANSERTIRSYS